MSEDLRADVPVHSDAAVPAGLLDAFWAYDVALLTNDVTTLDRLFADRPTTLRADGNGVLEGHAAIADFRAARSEVPRRRVEEVWLRVLGDARVYTTASVVTPTGGHGLQTQLWEHTAGRWQIVGAHVSAAPPLLDPAVWRVAGTPLVAGNPTGTLRGLTVAVKDVLAVAGVVRAGGVRALLADGRPEPAHATSVAVLLAAGADVVGVAQTDQLAFGLAGANADFGTPTNPAAADRLPGGSTSGPAVAVARGWATIGLGTDTAGSIRVPASYQGLWGFRPSHGAVDVTGVLALAPSFDTVGWITRDAETARRVGDALLPAEDAADLGHVYRSPDLEALADGDVRAVVDRAAVLLRAGSIDPVPDLALWTSSFRAVQAAEAWREHGATLTTRPGILAPDVAARFHAGSSVSPEAESAARTVLAEARAWLVRQIGDGLLVLPTVATTVPRIGATTDRIEAHRARTLPLTTLASLAGLPAVSLPAGRVGGAPCGLSLVGPPGRDRALLRRAGEVAALLG